MKPVVILCRDLKSGQEQVHAFSYSPVVIGRARDTDVRLDVAHVSNFHAQIDADDGSVAFTDLDSSNGSVVNGVSRRHQRVPIVADMRIQIGTFLLAVTRDLPPGVIARRRAPKKDDTTGAGARQDRTNVLDFDAKEALRSLPGAIRPREAPPAAPPPVVKLEPLDAPAGDKPRVVRAPHLPPTPTSSEPLLEPAPPQTGVISALPSGLASIEQSKTATLLQAPAAPTPQPRATPPSSRPMPARQAISKSDLDAAVGEVPAPPTGKRRLTVPMVVTMGLFLGAALGVLVFGLLFS